MISMAPANDAYAEGRTEAELRELLWAFRFGLLRRLFKDPFLSSRIVLFGSLSMLAARAAAPRPARYRCCCLRNGSSTLVCPGTP